MIWLDEGRYNLQINPSKRSDKITKYFAQATGVRSDLIKHEPVYSLQNLNVPEGGIGIPLRRPFQRWIVNSNQVSRLPIGCLLRYKVNYI